MTTFLTKSKRRRLTIPTKDWKARPFPVEIKNPAAYLSLLVCVLMLEEFYRRRQTSGVRPVRPVALTHRGRGTDSDAVMRTVPVEVPGRPWN